MKGNNEDLIKQYNLSEAVKRIQMINEYSFYSQPQVVEDDQDPNAMGGDQQQGADPNAMGGNMGGGMPQDAQDSNAMDGNTDIDQNVMGDMPQDAQDHNAMMGDDIGSDMPPMGDDQSGFSDEENIEDVEMDTEQPGDEVVDVDELTQSQETTEFKVDHVDDKLNKVLKVISKFTDAIEANDQKIEDLKKEFEKRNPTAEETLNLRSLASYPFSERPDKYWKKQKEEHPNYKVVSNNEVPTSDEIKIYKSDVDNFNERDIMKSLGEEHIQLSDFLVF